MSNDFTITKLSELKAYIDNLGKATVAYACQTAIIKMRNRITEGYNIDGTPFKPYSKKPIFIKSPYVGMSKEYEGGYEQYKEAIGYGSKPNLMVTGHMLNGILYASDEHYGKIYTAMQEVADKIEANEALGRTFFGLNETETESIFSEIVTKIRGDVSAILSM